jgi:hypothetical protein
MKKPSVPIPAAENWSRVDLGPELPLSVFTSSDRWNPERIGALALYCSDGRWGEAFDEFCHRHLLIPRYDRLALAGGPACLAPRGSSESASATVRPQLDFLVRAHELKQIVLITHYGCAFYHHFLHLPPDECLPVQIQEAQAVGALLGSWYPEVRVQAFLAMRQGNGLSFHPLDF